MYRITWNMPNPPEDWEEATAGTSAPRFESAQDAYQAIIDHYIPLLGPHIDYWVEDENGYKVTTGMYSNEHSSEPVRQVVDFHRAFNLPVSYDRNGEGVFDLLMLRLRLLEEEFNEVKEAVTDLVAVQGRADYQTKRTAWNHLLKELNDLRYVTYGFGIAFGLPLDEAFNLVHESNMSKLGNDGKPIMRADGKVLKSGNYRPADLMSLSY